MKKKTKKLICVLLCAALIFLLAVPGTVKGEKQLFAVAHRGFSGSAPENTLAAFRLAGEAGYSGCEFDIRLTKDKVWVVMHDDSVDRTTNGSGNVSELTYSELSELTIDGGNGLEKYPEEKIPTLTEALDVCREYSLAPVVEIKGGESGDMASLAKILSARKEKENVVLISFSEELLEALKKLMPETEMWLLTGTVLPSHISFCRKNKIDGISFAYKNNASASIAMIECAGLKAVSWTVDSAFAARRLAQRGVAGITTNSLLPQELNVKENLFGLIWKKVFNPSSNG